MKNLAITITLTSVAELEALLDGLDMFADCNDEGAAASELTGPKRSALLTKVSAARNLAKNIRGER